MSIQITGGQMPTSGGTLTGPLAIAVGSAAAPGLAVAGDALMVMESPLVAKTTRHINQRFYPVWREIGAFLLLMAGSAVDAQDVTPVFRDAASIQPRAQAEIRQLSVNAGIPLVTVLSDEGWTPAEIDQMTQDKEAEQATATAGLGQALLAQQRQFDQGMGQGGKQ